MSSTFFASQKLTEKIKDLNSFVEFFLAGIWENFLISPSILKMKKSKTTFWESQDLWFSVLNVYTADTTQLYSYEIILHGTKTI